MPLTVRSATPEDAPLLGWACFQASRSQLARGWFDIVLRRDEAFCLEFCRLLVLAKARSWWHWSLFQVAEMDGVGAAALCGFGDEAVYYRSSEAMAEASGKMGIGKEEQAQLWPRGAFIVSPATSEPGAWTIENAAVKPEFRGHGAIEALLEREVKIARQVGFRRMQISIFMGNTAAERAYNKAGFVFAEEKRAKDFEAALGIPGVQRLVRDI